MPFVGFENVDADEVAVDAPATDHPATIRQGFENIDASLTALVGDTAPPKSIDDARAYLNAAERCINAFVGVPQEAPT